MHLVFLLLIIRKYGIKISDFGKSWRDGLAFNAIVHTIRPDLIDFENVRNQSARANLEQAFSTAEDHLGIARLLDPEGRHHTFTTVFLLNLNLISSSDLV